MINKQTGVTIGLAFVILGTAVSAAWWFGKWTGEDRAWKLSTDKRLEQIEESITDGGASRWTSMDMLRWTGRLSEANPDLRVPKPYVD